MQHAQQLLIYLLYLVFAIDVIGGLIQEQKKDKRFDELMDKYPN